MKTIKENWTDKDFMDMGWHDSYIYTMYFPTDDLILKFDIDYIFEWVLDDRTGFYKFWISPCILSFFNVLNLDVRLSFENTTGIYIESIIRSNPQLTSNGKVTIWDYKIMTDKGLIKFTSTGYKQIVKQQPVLSQNQMIARD